MSEIRIWPVKEKDGSHRLEKGEVLFHGSWSNGDKKLAEVVVPLKGRRIGKRTYEFWMTDVIYRLRSAILEFGAKDLERGINQAERLRCGREKQNGTPEENQQRWAGYQTWIDRLLKKRPLLSYDRAAKLTAKRFGVCKKTIKRRTTDARQAVKRK